MTVGKIDEVYLHLVFRFEQDMAHAAALLGGLQDIIGRFLVVKGGLEASLVVETKRVDRLQTVFDYLANHQTGPLGYAAEGSAESGFLGRETADCSQQDGEE
jgi:hypothetical protein